MSVLPIRTVPDPVLRTPCRDVDPGRSGLHRLVSDMLETMDDVGGVGLAAPQVGVGLRLFTFGVGPDRGHVINPVLTTSGPLVREPGEGCLSVPGLHYRLERFDQATVTGVDVDGEPVTVHGTGLLARCLQHEVDHLDGTLFVDRLDGEDRRDARRRLRAPGYADITDQTHARRSTTVTSSFGTAVVDTPGGA